jgi:hypothetical protein
MLIIFFLYIHFLSHAGGVQHDHEQSDGFHAESSDSEGDADLCASDSDHEVGTNL